MLSTEGRLIVRDGPDQHQAASEEVELVKQRIEDQECSPRKHSVRTGESARCHTSQPEAVFHMNGTLLDFILISRPTSPNSPYGSLPR